MLFLIILMAMRASYGDSIGLYAENDTLQNSDGYYTHGSQIRYESKDLWGIRASQIINTPENKGSKDPQYGDRPYSGFLTLGFFMHHPSDWGDDYFEVDGGVVGPWSGAELAQTEVHRALHQMLPQGWKWQLHNEPVAQLTYYKSQTIKLNRWVEYKPYVGADLGTPLVAGQMGNVARFGYRMPKWFSPFIGTFSQETLVKRDDPKWYGYGFIGCSGQYKVWDMSLEGNLLNREPNEVTVDPYRFVAHGYFGLCLGLYGVEATVTHHENTDQFADQPRRERYDGLALAYRW